jgi:type I restriction enzyme R subunit
LVKPANQTFEVLNADENILALVNEAHCQRPPRVQAAVQAWRYRDTLQKIEFAAVISGSNNDDAAWKRWTEAAANETRIKRFKKLLFHAKPEKTDPLAFLVVKSMLLTGSDAPIEGVMYLDRPIREAELLQAIARVNRTGFGKRLGIVVDDCGVAEHLREALAAYANADIQGALQSLKDEVPALRDRHLRVVDLFLCRGIDLLDEVETCVEVLADARLRADSPSSSSSFWARWMWCCRARKACCSQGTPRPCRTSPCPCPATATKTRPFWSKTWPPRCGN